MTTAELSHEEEAEEHRTCGARKSGHEGQSGVTRRDILALMETQRRLHTRTRTARSQKIQQMYHVGVSAWNNVGRDVQGRH